MKQLAILCSLVVARLSFTWVEAAAIRLADYVDVEYEEDPYVLCPRSVFPGDDEAPPSIDGPPVTATDYIENTEIGVPVEKSTVDWREDETNVDAPGQSDSEDEKDKLDENQDHWLPETPQGGEDKLPVDEILDKPELQPENQENFTPEGNIIESVPEQGYQDHRPLEEITANPEIHEENHNNDNVEGIPDKPEIHQGNQNNWNVEGIPDKPEIHQGNQNNWTVEGNPEKPEIHQENQNNWTVEGNPEKPEIHQENQNNLTVERPEMHEEHQNNHTVGGVLGQPEIHQEYQDNDPVEEITDNVETQPENEDYGAYGENAGNSENEEDYRADESYTDEEDYKDDTNGDNNNQGNNSETQPTETTQNENDMEQTMYPPMEIRAEEPQDEIVEWENEAEDCFGSGDGEQDVVIRIRITDGDENNGSQSQ